MKEYIDAFSEKDAVLEPSIVKTFEKSVHTFTFNLVIDTLDYDLVVHNFRVLLSY